MPGRRCGRHWSRAGFGTSFTRCATSGRAFGSGCGAARLFGVRHLCAARPGALDAAPPSRPHSADPGQPGAADRLSAARWEDQLRPAVLGLYLKYQSRGGPALASQIARPGQGDHDQLSALRLAGTALLSGRGLRDRRGSRDRRAAPADQRAQLRALQDLRHQGPGAEYRLGSAGGRRRTQLPEYAINPKVVSVDRSEVSRVQSVKIGHPVESGLRRSLAPAWAVLLLAATFGMPNSASAAPQDKPAAQDKSAGQDKSAVLPEHLFGEYLAGRHAQQRRDFTGAAKWFEKAIGDDPDSPEILSRTFLMEVSVGHFDRALTLAPKELKLDPGDAVAQLVLLSDRLKAGDAAGALKYAAALPSDGVHRFIAPFALAWTRVAAGDLAGADTALQGLDNINYLQTHTIFQHALLYDFAKQTDKAQQY